VPAAIAGLVWGDYFEESFKNAGAAAIQLGITAIILVAAELALRYHSRRVERTGGHLRTMDQLNVGDASAIGVAQAIAIFPGISRSGSTIGAGLALSVTRDDAARFSFLLAIPSLLGATVLEVPELQGADLGIGAGVAGFVSSLVFSYAAIAGLIRYLRSNNLYPFAVYCVVAAIVFYAIV
jgi:undecaprenyl-diphosphatase